MRYVLTIETDRAIHGDALVDFADNRHGVDPDAHVRVILEYDDDEEI